MKSTRKLRDGFGHELVQRMKDGTQINTIKSLTHKIITYKDENKNDVIRATRNLKCLSRDSSTEGWTVMWD